MIITKPAIKRVTTKISELAKAQDTTSEKLVKEIKTFVLQSVAAKGIPVNIAEEVAARLIVLVSIIDAPKIGK